MDSLFSYSSSPAHLRAVNTCFEVIMSRGPSTLAAPGLSSASLGLDSNGHAGSDLSQISKDGTYVEMLSEIGMNGMVEPFYRSYAGRKCLDLDKAKEAASCVPHLVELIIAQ